MRDEYQGRNIALFALDEQKIIAEKRYLYFTYRKSGRGFG
ncbi:hypothetical protein HMPREF1870_01877 [Bacteroidales bacterium KA00344]|nr:hypothetical protein HMPREF1870_01877 [Bacteroidales bacterium KA00344]